MSQVGPVSSVRGSSFDAVTTGTRILLKDLSPMCWRVRCSGRKALSSDPLIKSWPRLDHYANQHHRVLSTTELRTLAQIDSGLMRINPHSINFVGNEISFTGQARDPKAMGDI